MTQRTFSTQRTDSLVALNTAVAIRFSVRAPRVKRTVSSRHGFTLLEMIVVITIIAILLGISTAMLAGMKQKGQAAVTRDTAKQLAEAWTRHLQMLGEWPAAIQSTAEGTAHEANAAHLKILNQMKGDTPALGYYFLELSKEEKENGLKDKWGTVFALWFDTDYDGLIPHPHPPKEAHAVRTAVIVGSPGKDKVWGTKDDISVH